MHRNHNKQARKRPTKRPVRNTKVGPVAAPDSETIKLKYPIKGTLATVGTVIAKRWTPNAAYDVDPALGSTSTPGFAEEAARFTYYRVEKFKLRVTFSNLDNLGVSLYSVVSNTDPGTAGTNYFNYAQSAFGRTFELAPFYSGRGTVTLNQTVNIAQVIGMDISQADSFRSVTTSIPTDLVYWGFGIYSNALTNFANGVSYSGTIEMYTRFYSRQDQLLSLYRPSGVEWEADRILFKMERDRKYKALPQEDQDKKKQEYDRKVQEIVRLKLSQAASNPPVMA